MVGRWSGVAGGREPRLLQVCVSAVKRWCRCVGPAITEHTGVPPPPISGVCVWYGQ